MEIIKEFGLDPILLGAQVINFLIILFLLKKFLYKPLLEMLSKREDAIKEGIKQAEEGRLTLERALDEEKNILKLAQNQARKILSESREQAYISSKQIEETTRKQAEKILSEARDQITEETKQAEKILSEKVFELSSELVKKTLNELISEKDEKMLIEKAIRKLKDKNE